MKPLKLEILFGSRDTLSPALRLMVGSSNAATKAIKKTKDELKRLNDQQKKVDGYIKQKKATEDSAKALKDVQDRIKSLRQQMASNPSAELTRDFEKARAAAKRLKDSHQQNQQQLQRLRSELTQSGVSTNNLSQHQVELRRRTDQANAELERQRNALRNLNTQQQNYQRHSQRARNAGMAGMMMAGTGVAAMYQMKKPIEESKRVDIEEARIASLGLGKESTEEAIKYAKAMKTYGTSTLDNLQLVRDGVTAFADVHHAQLVAPTLAKMKFANEAMYGNEHGAENEKKFMDMLKVIEMRNGLKSEKAFQDQANIIQQVITATGGRVQAEEWLNVIKTGGIAAKGMSNEAFYYKMEPLVQEMGGHRVGTSMMSAYQNLYQGRTTQRAANNLAKFDLIGDLTKVKHNKTGDLSYLDIGAIKGSDLFKKDQFAWMEKVLVPALNAKGITKEGDVIDAIGSIFSNRTASNLFAQMYMQREQIHKNAKLNAGADNIDQLNTKAMDTTGGKELEAKARLHDAYLQFGQTILPIYTQAIITATNALQGFTTWMQKNPTLAKALGTGLLVIAAGLIGIGGLLVVFSPLILGMLSLRLMMFTLGAQGSALGFAFKALASPFRLIGSTAKWLGKTLFAVGRMMIANPIILAVTLLATAAFLIYKNWEPIKTFFADVWGKVVGIFQAGVNWIKGIVQSIDTVFANNPILTFLFPLIGIPRLIIANWSSISGFFSDIWSSIKTGAGEAWSSITAYWAPVGQWFAEIWAPVKTSGNEAWESLKSTFSPVGQWFSSRWQDIKTVFSGGILGISNIILNWSPIGLFYAAFAKVLSWFGIDLPAKFTGFGSMIIDGLVNGIKSGFQKLKSIWTEVNNYMPDFMRTKMDIHSPSRVMAGLGGFIVDGLGVGINRAFPELQHQYSKVLNIFTGGVNSPAMDKVREAVPLVAKVMPAKPLSTSRRPGGITIQGDTISIQVTPTPGQPINDLIRQIEQVLERRDRQKAARLRDSYYDKE